MRERVPPQPPARLGGGTDHNLDPPWSPGGVDQQVLQELAAAHQKVGPRPMLAAITAVRHRAGHAQSRLIAMHKLHSKNLQSCLDSGIIYKPE